MKISILGAGTATRDAAHINESMQELRDALCEGGEAKKQAYAKFVVIERVSTSSNELRERLGFLFYNSFQHANEAFAIIREMGNASFVGGGTYREWDDERFVWKSPSCIRMFGKDRPEDSQTATDILLELEQSVDALNINSARDSIAQESDQERVAG